MERSDLPTPLDRRSFMRRGALAAGAAGGAALLGAAAAPDPASAAFAPGPDDFRVADYGAVGDGRTDDTAAIQAAIDAAYAHADRGAGHARVLFDAKTYRLAAAPVRPVTNYFESASGQLLLPRRTSGAPVNIELVGAGSQQGKQNVIGTPEQSGGTTLRSTVTARWSGHSEGVPPAILAAQGGNDWGQFGRVTVAITGIAFRAPVNPTLIGLNLLWAPQVRLQGVRVDTPDDWPQVTEPTHTWASGIVLPYVNNNAVTYLRDVHVSGYWTGIHFAEHTDASTLVVWGCKVGLAPLGQRAHNSIFNLATVEWCTNFIAQTDWEIGRVACTGEGFIFNLLDIEEYNGYGGQMGWSAVDQHIYDPNNKMQGWVRIARSSAMPLATTGCAHLSISSLNAL